MPVTIVGKKPKILITIRDFFVGILKCITKRHKVRKQQESGNFKMKARGKRKPQKEKVNEKERVIEKGKREKIEMQKDKGENAELERDTEKQKMKE